MKHSLFLVLSGLAATATATPSSPFDIYGVLDVNLRHVQTGSASALRQDSDGSRGSRLGFRGTEALGNDLSAGFTLETALKPDTGESGSSSALWSRRSTVSLVSRRFGELRAGRDATPTWNDAVEYDHFGTGIGSLSKLFVPAGVYSSEIFGRRINNTLSYFLPGGLGGWYGQLQLAPDEGAGNGKSHGARLGYQAHGFNVSVAQLVIDVTGGKFKQLHAGASYDIGVAKLLGQWVTTETTVGSGARSTVWELGAVIPVSAPGTLKLGFARASGYAHAIKPTVGYTHDLSKRTLLYTNVTQIRNRSSRAAYAVENAPSATAGLRQNSTGYEIGMRHLF